MENFLQQLTTVNNAINDFVWVRLGLILLLGTGVLLTVLTKFFQISHLGHWWKSTIVSVFKKDGKATKNNEEKSPVCSKVKSPSFTIDCFTAPSVFLEKYTARYETEHNEPIKNAFLACLLLINIKLLLVF